MSLPFIYMRKILVAIMAFTLLASVAEARKVKGTVTSGAEFLEGVVVTDGEHFTTTNSKVSSLSRSTMMRNLCTW